MPAFFQKTKKTVRVLRFRETKPTSRNAFIVKFFALESKKQPMNDEKSSGKIPCVFFN